MPDESPRPPLALADARLLALDAATATGSVAVLHGARVLREAEVAMRGEREERLMPAVLAAVADAGLALHELDAIVCGGGPGSFTSLRIAASIAKGLALALDRPLYAVPSLALVAAGQGRAGRWLAALDAMRGERFAQLVVVDASGAAHEEGPARRVADADLSALATSLGAIAIGPGVAGSAARPLARGVAALLDRMAAAGPVSLDAWEPEYGRLAEAQVQWEAAHGRPLASVPPVRA